LKTYFVRTKDTFVEGTIGKVVNLNPIFLTQNQVDKDIRHLVFQRFIELDDKGNPLPSIATSWEIDDTSTQYTFHLNNNIKFSDGYPLTANDVKYTFDTAIYLADKYDADTIGKSISGVSIEVIDDYTIKFTLNEENATFYEAVSVLILPQHYYGKVASEQIEYSNASKFPIGSGPYVLQNQTDTFLTLVKSEYFNPTPKIAQIEYRLYADFASLKVAFQNNTLDAVSNVGAFDTEISSLSNSFADISKPLEIRKKMIYLNNRNSLLSNASVRRGLAYSTDRNRLINNADISGSAIKGPYNEDSWVFNTDIEYPDFKPEKALKEFLDAGYSKNKDNGYYESSDGKILALTISYLDTELNQRIVTELTKQWEEQGVILKASALTYDQIIKETISTRNFELLLYEVETTIDPDQYNLWHSLKIDYPNLNLAGYKYNRSDILLERARKTNKIEDRTSDYKQFAKYLMNDSPVIFLYQPEYHYFVSKKIKNIVLQNFIYPADRYDNIYEWEIE
jgi:peptide/nickel transport system substrate-binding protein